MDYDRFKTLIYPIFCLLASAFLAYAEDHWNKEIATIVTRSGYVGPGADFKTDAMGTIHASYSSTEITGDFASYVRWTPSGQQELLRLSNKSRRSYHAKIALSANGNPAVAFVDEEGIKIARRSVGGWFIQTISATGHFDFSDLSLAIDSLSQVHVLFNGYEDITGRVFLKYMHENQGGWVSEYLYPSGMGTGNHGQFHDIVLSETDEPHIVFQSCDSYASPTMVKYAHKNLSGSFVVEDVANWNNLGDIEICRESNGVIHVVHPGYNSHLSYARRSLDGVWSDNVLVNPNDPSGIQPNYPDISVEKGIPTIAYKNLRSRLTFATLQAGIWTFTESSGIVGSFGPILSHDHRGRICCLYSGDSRLWLDFVPSSFLPEMKIRTSGAGTIMIDFGGLTPHTNYVLKRSPDLANWTKVQDLSSEVGFCSYEEIKSNSSGFYRVELPN